MENTRIQVSQELSQKPMPRRVIGRPPTLKPIVSAHERTDEICIPSSGESVHLFFESEGTVNSVGFNFVKIHYIMEKRNDALFYDPLEECRPCTDIELIDAYRSHEVDTRLKRIYQINMDVMFCYETYNPQCDSSDILSILKNTKLPKHHCDWSAHFVPSVVIVSAK